MTKSATRSQTKGFQSWYPERLYSHCDTARTETSNDREAQRAVCQCTKRHKLMLGAETERGARVGECDAVLSTYPAFASMPNNKGAYSFSESFVSASPRNRPAKCGLTSLLRMATDRGKNHALNGDTVAWQRNGVEFSAPRVACFC